MLSSSTICVALMLFAVSVSLALGSRRQKYSLDLNWKFALDDVPSGGFGPSCSANTWTKNLNGQQCLGLQQVGGAHDEDDCARACCNSAACEVYQWCNTTDCMPSAQDACWIGRMSRCSDSKGWVSQGRTMPPAPPPGPGTCNDPRCQSNFVDTNWTTINVPHDFIVEGIFNATTGDKSHGYLPYSKGWYRKHFTVPTSLKGQTIYIEFDGTQANTDVYLNGIRIGGHASGYTPYRFKLNQSALKFGAENVLVVFVDATHPDGWWYDGGGIYRHVWLTAVDPVHVEPWGVYAPALVTGAISRLPTRASDLPSPTSASGARLQASTASVLPQVEVGNDSPSAVTATVTGVVYGPDGNTAVGTSTAHVSVPSGGNATVALPNVTVTNAALWHVGTFQSAKQPLYTLSATVTVDGNVVDVVNVSFGIRKTEWKAATGFYLNDEPTKILGNANHQDFAGVGVAVPDVLQAYRIGKLQEMNANGWRTAHNVPTEALLIAADEMGFLVWDENHRNGQDSEVEILIRRDRNHPSVVIWSLCNEVLCNTHDMEGDMTRLKLLIRSLDPHGQRVVSANNNGANGANTPLDLQGFDYNTNNYDSWHARAPNVPAISSETSSAVSDRDEIKNDEANGVVSGYDDKEHGNTVGWGQSAEGAWGGVGMNNGQGILTRPFIAGGFTWTGWDYKGEPTPYAWPDINSHFGIIDEAAFPRIVTTGTRRGSDSRRPHHCTCFPTGTGMRVTKSTSGHTATPTRWSCLLTASRWGRAHQGTTLMRPGVRSRIPRGRSPPWRTPTGSRWRR
eukprot:m.1217283 g.1217283  ORF g.1217283 m.1217283 type:complete len:792 (-) comp24617_c1_seq18:2782-5157(-)